MNQTNEGKGPQMEIELTEGEATGTYSNMVMISHSNSEFILDFISIMPGVPKGKVVKRMIVSPDHAKRLAKALDDNIKRYENENGPISGSENNDVPFNYRGPMPEA